MAAERIIRITRTWDVVVAAEYGDDDDSLMAKAEPGLDADATETRNVMPEGA
jgi:hypothetical protein